MPAEEVSSEASPSGFRPRPSVPGLFSFRARVILLADDPTPRIGPNKPDERATRANRTDPTERPGVESELAGPSRRPGRACCCIRRALSSKAYKEERRYRSRPLNRRFWSSQQPLPDFRTRAERHARSGFSSCRHAHYAAPQIPRAMRLPLCGYQRGAIVPPGPHIHSINDPTEAAKHSAGK
jgi:hypothetical protein